MMCYKTDSRSRPRPDVTTAHFHALSHIFGGDRYCLVLLDIISLHGTARKRIVGTCKHEKNAKANWYVSRMQQFHLDATGTSVLIYM